MRLPIPAFFLTQALMAAVDVPVKPTALYSSCSRSEQIGVLPAAADVKVTSSIAGEDGVCFRVVGALNGQPVNGAIFDPSHPAAVTYREALNRPPAPPAPPPAAAPPPAPARATRFENFSGSNFHDGERFELARLHARVILLHFWESAQDASAKRDAEYLAHLKSQYGDQGLEVVGITSESSPDRVRTFNENTEAVWPLIRDRDGLAEKYGVTASSEIFVLDGRRNILATKVQSAELEALLSKRLGRR